MIEKQILAKKLKEHKIQKYIGERLNKTGYSHTEIKRTPLGEKIIIYTTRPGIVVGGRGGNIQDLTNILKKRFKMENPQIEIGELKNPMLDAYYVCDKIVSTLERFGPNRFKSIGYRTLQAIMDAGALGAEIVISGKVPSARARSWRFSAGYLKKSGDISENYVNRVKNTSLLKSGIVGVKVSIMLPDVPLSDKIEFKEINENKKEDTNNKTENQVKEKVIEEEIIKEKTE